MSDSDRTETCTPEERRLLDAMRPMGLVEMESTNRQVTIRLEAICVGDPTGHAIAAAFHAARAAR